MVCHHEGAAKNFLLITTESLRLNLNIETSYVSVAQEIAVKL